MVQKLKLSIITVKYILKTLFELFVLLYLISAKTIVYANDDIAIEIKCLTVCKYILNSIERDNEYYL